MVQDSVDPTLATGDVDDLMLIAAVPYQVPLQDMFLAAPYSTSYDPLAPYWTPPDHVVLIAPDSYASWQANTVYAPGTVIVPTVRNKYAYKVTVAGTSGGSEPTWPTSGTVVSGTVTFTNVGLSWMPSYDLNRAAAEGWRWKAAKASARFSFGEGGTSYSREQVTQACLAMAKEYARKSVMSVTIGPRHPQERLALDQTREGIRGAQELGRPIEGLP
jgi:hypothetical protein